MSVPAHRLPRRVMTRTLGFGLSALVAAGMLTWSPAVTSGWNQGSAEATLWQLLNGARTNNGMAPLQQHGTLVSLARWRSSDMLAKDYFSHTIAGCGCLVYPYYDSNGLSYDWAGENIGWNAGLDDSYSPVRVHEKFMASPGHRVNVLDRRFTHGGVGAAAADNQRFQGYVQNTRMYTELFLQAPSAAPAPPPAPPSQPPAPAPAPAPAPQPPSGGGASAPVPAPVAAPAAPAPAAPAPAAQPKPKAESKPKEFAVDSPRRPVSAAGLEGVATLVSSPNRDDVTARLMVEEHAAARAAVISVSVASVTVDEPVAVDLEVTAAPASEPGLLDGIVGVVLGFLFG